MKGIYSTTELDEALVYQALLREHGIESIIENERSAFLVVDMPTCAVPFVISVPDDQVSPALELVKAARSHGLEEDAPSPEATAPETDALEERVAAARRLRHRKWWAAFLVFFLLPAICLTLAFTIQGYWDVAAGAGIIFSAVPVSAWILIRRHQRKPS